MVSAEAGTGVLLVEEASVVGVELESVTVVSVTVELAVDEATVVVVDEVIVVGSGAVVLAEVSDVTTVEVLADVSVEVALTTGVGSETAPTVEVVVASCALAMLSAKPPTNATSAKSKIPPIIVRTVMECVMMLQCLVMESGKIAAHLYAATFLKPNKRTQTTCSWLISTAAKRCRQWG